MTPNHQSLIDQIEKTKELDSRFQDIVCMNMTAKTRRGVMSLVFQAKDKTSDKHVALKFMDPDILSNKYRIDAFEREPEILEKIEHKKRCLSLVVGLSNFYWKLLIPGSASPIDLPIKYFAVDWLEEEIDDFFLVQHTVEPIEKLKIFRLILLAVEALHSENVHHRDLKPDNMRATMIDGEQVVIVIDFGTSAHDGSPNILPKYGEPVGANAYSSPEAFAGLAGFRELGKLADIYALGCLLYELFNKEIFGKARAHNSNFDNSLMIMAAEMARATSLEEKTKVWKSKMPLVKNVVIPPSIEGAGNSVPPAIKNLLSKAFSQMVNFDFTERVANLELIRKTIDSSIKVLQNDKKQKIIIARKKEDRRKRLEKVKKKQERLDNRISRRLTNVKS